MRGGYAWNLVGPAPVASPRDLDARVHDLWTTPHGVIKAALANQPTLTPRTQDGRTLWAVSFVMPGRLRAMALINADGLVEQIESVLPNPVMGDTGSVITFSDYQDVGGVKFPKRIRQSLGGFPGAGSGRERGQAECAGGYRGACAGECGDREGHGRQGGRGGCGSWPGARTTAWPSR
jgi:hypothetical protein